MCFANRQIQKKFKKIVATKRVGGHHCIREMLPRAHGRRRQMFAKWRATQCVYIYYTAATTNNNNNNAETR